MTSLWPGGGGVFQVNLTTLQSECLITVYVLQSERTVCPSSPARKGMGTCGTRGLGCREQVCARMPSREQSGEEARAPLAAGFLAAV